MRGAVADGARLVLRTRLALPQVSEPTLNREQYRSQTWSGLLAEGAVVHRRVASPAGETDLYAALFTPAAIGASLVGLNRYNEYMRRFPPGTQVIAVASSGAYDFLGDDYVRAEKRYRFDRIRVRQGSNLFHFVNADFLRLDTRAYEGFLSQQYAAIFALPPTFDPLKEWQLELLAVTAAGSEASFPLVYRLPAAYVLMPERPAVPVWVEAWRDARVNIAILVGALIVLTLIFVFQDRLARSRLTHRLVRTGFLLFVLIWLGWAAGGQLSIINVMHYAVAPLRGFDTALLLEPLIVIIAVYTAISLVLIGRGVFCGWLCPFGALQELLAQAARALRLPQWMPFRATRKPVALRQVHRGGGAADPCVCLDRERRECRRDRAVQDRDHGEVHPRLALRRLCARTARHWPFHRTRLLPLLVSARRRAGGARPNSICSTACAVAPSAAARAGCARPRVRCGRSRSPGRS